MDPEHDLVRTLRGLQKPPAASLSGRCGRSLTGRDGTDSPLAKASSGKAWPSRNGANRSVLGAGPSRLCRGPSVRWQDAAREVTEADGRGQGQVSGARPV